jgi:hypothetical protein
MKNQTANNLLLFRSKIPKVPCGQQDYSVNPAPSGVTEKIVFQVKNLPAGIHKEKFLFDCLGFHDTELKYPRFPKSAQGAGNHLTREDIWREVQSQRR